jgi:hypothetical protein
MFQILFELRCINAVVVTSKPARVYSTDLTRTVYSGIPDDVILID